MDHSRAPLLEAVADYHRADRYGFTPPGHRQGRGVDPRVLDVLGHEPVRADLLASAGLDDRSSSSRYLARAEEVMADAVRAEHASFSTCGSSLSVKAAMLAVAGHDGHLILGRDVHKSVVAGMVFSGLQPCWVRPRWDAELHIAHPPSPERMAEAWERYPHAAGALIVSPTPYGACADIGAIAEICHERDKPSGDHRSGSMRFRGSCFTGPLTASRSPVSCHYPDRVQRGVGGVGCDHARLKPGQQVSR